MAEWRTEGRNPLKKPLKILIIRFSSIGDIVLTTPVIRCLKLQRPDTEIHYVIKKQFLPVLRHNPYIDKLHLLDTELKDLLEGLRAERFDYVIDLHKTLRSYLVRLALGRKTFSFPKLSIRKWLLTRLRIDLLPKGLHIVERNLRSVRPLGIRNDGKGLDYFIGAAEEVSPERLPESHRGGYIAFVIGGQHFTKRLPLEKLLTVCRETQLPLLLLGGPEDRPVAEELQRRAGGQVHSLCGQLSLNESVSLLRKARVVIAHDTGLMHIAAAFDKPVISVWGNTSARHFGVWPYLSSDSFLAEVPGLPCRPCHNFGRKACPLKHFKCMQLQDASLIAHEARVKFERNSAKKL